MPAAPELGYDETACTIVVETPDAHVDIHSDASKEEFEQIKTIDELLNEASGLPDTLLQVLIRQQSLVEQNQYTDCIVDLQNQTASYYQRCSNLQPQIENSESDIVTEHVGQLYKLKKLLTHFFRCLAIAQSLGFSRQLLFQYLESGQYVYLYSFVRHTCSTIEYLGKLMINRKGDGQIDIDESGTHCEEVYEQLKAEGLDETLAPDQEVTIPPAGRSIPMKDIGLTRNSMEFLRTKRNLIVHHCPLVIPDESAEMFPDEILSSYTLTESDLRKLTELTTRLHHQSVGIFIQFTAGYVKDMSEPLVEAWYLEQDNEE